MKLFSTNVKLKDLFCSVPKSRLIMWGILEFWCVIMASNWVVALFFVVLGLGIVLLCFGYLIAKHATKVARQKGDTKLVAVEPTIALVIICWLAMAVPGMIIAIITGEHEECFDSCSMVSAEETIRNAVFLFGVIFALILVGAIVGYLVNIVRWRSTVTVLQDAKSKSDTRSVIKPEESKAVDDVDVLVFFVILSIINNGIATGNVFSESSFLIAMSAFGVQNCLLAVSIYKRIVKLYDKPLLTSVLVIADAVMVSALIVCCFEMSGYIKHNDLDMAFVNIIGYVVGTVMTSFVTICIWKLIKKK